MWKLVISLLCAGSLASAGTPRRHDVDRTLTASEAQRYSAVYLPAVRDCYVAHAPPRAPGLLELRLGVDRDGSVLWATATAPGVRGAAAHRLEVCVREKVATWHFPVRRHATEVVLPYYFQRTYAPGGGPQPSCWNPRGCPDKPERMPRKTI